MSFTQNKCSSESCCCIGSTFGVPIPTIDSTKKTASKQLRRGKLLVKVYHHHHHHHQPVDHQSLAVLINLPLLFHSGSLCICIWRGSYSSFLCPESPNELLRYHTTTRTPTNRIGSALHPNRLRFSYDV